MTPYSCSSTIRTTSSPSLSLHERRCHLDGGTADTTRRWPTSELRSRWGRSASNLKLVSVLRNGWNNHICNWYPINSANIPSAPVMSDTKLTIRVYDTRHQLNQVVSVTGSAPSVSQSRTSNRLSRSQMTLLMLQRALSLFWGRTSVARCKARTWKTKAPRWNYSFPIALEPSPLHSCDFRVGVRDLTNHTHPAARIFWIAEGKALCEPSLEDT